jgi:hypothetical protein
LLEELAIQYVNQPEDVLGALGWLLMIGGAISAALFNRSAQTLFRAPYFSYSALLIMSAVVLQFTWLGTADAVVGGYLWILVVFDTISTFSIGFIFGTIAMARSRDAFGHGRFAVFAIIPIANLLLILRRSKFLPPTEPMAVAAFMAGWFGVVSGFIMLMLAVLFVVSLNQIVAISLENERADPAAARMQMDSLIQANGVEATLDLLVSGPQPPTPKDEDAGLIQIKAKGTQLQRIYLVASEKFTLADEYRKSIERVICSSDLFEPLLKAGASVNEIYLKPDGSEFGSHSVKWDSCVKLAK